MLRLLQNSIDKRAGLLESNTNAVRLVDGSGDGLPGLILETYADRWLVSTTGDSLIPTVREWLRDQEISCYWKRLDQHQKESPSHLAGPEAS
ncbi:MAG: class I SAM-dependent rRNA methyltransferase, partial [Opitutaceae bacterium]|nr:class I SAM-dependent rRNA methyltransferase [Verrucomicrobiales bacterium]